MPVNREEEETSALEQAVAWLGGRLPAGWRVEVSERETLDLVAPPVDARIVLQGPSGTMTAIAVEVRDSLEPRTVVSGLSPQVRTARRMGAHMPFLVIAPWLSRRTRQVLAEQDLNYIDLTGNALLRIDNPPFYLQTAGADRDPRPKEPQQAQLRGPKAARLIRALIDVRGPYGVGELSRATGLTPGYVSRLLDTLDREALIERAPRGPVESVDIAGLARRWARFYDVFDSNRALATIAPAGIEGLLEAVSRPGPEDPAMVITGSFAAAAMMPPIAAPALLLAYCERPGELATEHGLLRAEEGAMCILLSPFDRVACERSEFHGGLTYAAPSQVAVDCLTGNGRMPAEGEALLDWMLEHEGAWRLGELEPLGSRSDLSLPADPEYVAARRVLLDALCALGEHRDAVVVAGAQAIYLRAGAAVLPIADLTTDADLALDPALLSPAPDLEGLLKASGFEHVEHGGAPEPGLWEIETEVGGRQTRIPLDLIVPSEAAAGGRRSAELGPHGRRAARRSPGLEAALVDNESMEIAALEAGDKRVVRARVAGLPSLLVAKAYKISDRLADGDADRTYDKDASDVVRIMQSMPPAPMAAALAGLRDDPAAGASTSLGIEHFERLFGRRNGEGIAMAVRALRQAMPEARVRAICLAYAAGLGG